MSNKDRLYVCLYARGGKPKMPGLEDTYHWALLVGPKVETKDKQGVKYHAKEAVTQESIHWVFEREEISLEPVQMILIRVLIGKVRDTARLDAILRQVPIRGGEKDWNCVSWVVEALSTLEGDGKALGTSISKWDSIREAAMTYCEQKKAEGRFKPEKFNPKKVPTYDLLEGKETTS